MGKGYENLILKFVNFSSSVFKLKKFRGHDFLLDSVLSGQIVRTKTIKLKITSIHGSCTRRNERDVQAALEIPLTTQLYFMGHTMQSGYGTHLTLDLPHISYTCTLIFPALLHLFAGKEIALADCFGILETGSRCYCCEAVWHEKWPYRYNKNQARL